MKFFFIKTFSNFFTIKVTNQVHETVFLILLTTKTSSDQFEVYPLAKMILYFQNPNMITNFEFGIFFIRILVLFTIRIRCNVNWLHFYCSVNCAIVFINYIVQHNNIFKTVVMNLKILFFNVLINLSATTDFPSLYVECISLLFIFKNLFKLLL